jgi:WD40 repeat protein
LVAACGEQATLTGHTGEVFSVAVTPDGTRAVSGSSDGSVRVWDLATGRELAVLTGHTRQVFSVAVTPDKTLAVSGGEDGSVRIWHLPTGTEIARWTGDHPIVGCAVLPGRPFRVGVGERQGPPFLLGVIGSAGSPASEISTGHDQHGQPTGPRSSLDPGRPLKPDPANGTRG